VECPSCGSRTYVSQTFDKRDKIFRVRKCSNKKCKRTFKTTEMESYGWQYKNIVKKIKELVRDVK